MSRTRASGLEQHAECIAGSLRQLLRQPLGTALTVLVMGLALALPLAFGLLLANVQHLAGALGEAQAVNVYLRPGADSSAAAALANDVRQRPAVDAVKVVTPAEGLAELASTQGFGDAVRDLPDNPLPYLLEVTPRAGASRAEVETLVQALRARPGVDRVQDDGRWRARLDALLGLGRRTMLLLALLLGAAAVLVVGNSVRLNLRSRAHEIRIQRLLGAHAAFVRRPYLYEGAWYGLAAGIVAVALVVAVEAVLAAPVRQLAASYGGNLRLAGLPVAWLVAAVAVAIALGWLGAWIVSSAHWYGHEA